MKKIPTPLYMTFKVFLGPIPAYPSGFTSPDISIYTLRFCHTELLPIPATHQRFLCLAALPVLLWEASQFPQQPVLTSDAKILHATLHFFFLQHTAISLRTETGSFLFIV